MQWHNSQTLFFLPIRNYSWFSLFPMFVANLSQNAFRRLYFVFCDKKATRASGSFLHVCILAVQMWTGMSCAEAQPWKFCMYNHLLSVFHPQPNSNAVETRTTTSSWKALMSDDFLTRARDTSSAYAQRSWAEKVGILSTYSQSWNWPGLLEQMLNCLFFHHIIKEH